MAFAIIIVLFVFLIFAAPGILFAKVIWNNKENESASYIYGACIGLGLSCYISVITSFFWGWAPGKIIFTLALFTIILFICLKGKFYRNINKFRSKWRKDEIIFCVATMIFVLLFTGFVFSEVGKLTPNGYKYSWLFAHDYLGRSTTSVALTYGVPPPHFFFAGEKMRYYILSYSIGALAYSLGRNWCSIHQIMIALSILQSMIFILIITQFYKVFFNRHVLKIVLILGFYAYSFYGVFVLIRSEVYKYSIMSFIQDLSGVSHLFYRFFLVEPHTVLGLIIFFPTIVFIGNWRLKESITEIIVVGTLIGIEFGVEATLGLFLVLTYATVWTIRLLRKHIKMNEFIKVSFGAAIPTLLIYSTYLWSGIFSTTGESYGLKFVLDYFKIMSFPFMAFISFGPAWLFGGIGFIVWFIKDRRPDNIFFILGIIAIIFMVFITQENESYFGYLKGEKILFIVLLYFSGILFNYISEIKMHKRKLIYSIAVIIAFPALITPATDFYKITISDNEGDTYISYNDMKACQWIKKNLPQNAVIQSEPQYPGGKYSTSLIAKFAERRMAIGEWKLSGIKHNRGMDEVPKRYNDIKNKIFKTESIEEAYKTARIYQIDYIYVGEYERDLYPNESISKWEKKNEHFEKIYDQDSVTIYKINFNNSMH